jgi:hypothetical protein
MRNKDHILSGTKQCLPEHCSDQAARLYALVRAMCRPRAVPGLFNRRFPVAKINMVTGARRIRHPFPSLCGSVLPLYGSPVCWNRRRAADTASPMSKHSPVLLR